MLVAYVLLAWEHRKCIIYIFLQKLKDYFAQLFSPLGWKQCTLSWSRWQETGITVLQTWGFSLGFPCFLAEYPRRQTWWWGNWGQQDIQWAELLLRKPRGWALEPTKGGWRNPVPWSCPDRTHNHTCVCIHIHITVRTKLCAWENFTDGIEMT